MCNPQHQRHEYTNRMIQPSMFLQLWYYRVATVGVSMWQGSLLVDNRSNILRCCRPYLFYQQRTVYMRFVQFRLCMNPGHMIPGQYLPCQIQNIPCWLGHTRHYRPLFYSIRFRMVRMRWSKCHIHNLDCNSIMRSMSHRQPLYRHIRCLRWCKGPHLVPNQQMLRLVL